MMAVHHEGRATAPEGRARWPSKIHEVAPQIYFKNGKTEAKKLCDFPATGVSKQTWGALCQYCGLVAGGGHAIACVTHLSGTPRGVRPLHVRKVGGPSKSEFVRPNIDRSNHP